MKPLFDKTEFKKRMSKIFDMETESEKKAYQQIMRIQAEKEMKTIKAELLQGCSTRPPMCEAQYTHQPHHNTLNTTPNLLNEFLDYLEKKGRDPKWIQFPFTGFSISHSFLDKSFHKVLD